MELNERFKLLSNYNVKNTLTENNEMKIYKKF